MGWIHDHAKLIFIDPVGCRHVSRWDFGLVESLNVGSRSDILDQWLLLDDVPPLDRDRGLLVLILREPNQWYNVVYQLLVG